MYPTAAEPGLDVQKAAAYAMERGAFESLQSAQSAAEELNQSDVPLAEKRRVWAALCADQEASS
jgi:hypothetical protein